MAHHPGQPFDLITMGRSGVDLYPLQSGVGLEDVQTFAKFLGGSPTNVAVAAARLGLRSAVVTGVGDDPFGRYVRQEMRSLGVDDGQVVVIPELHTPVTFCEIFPPDNFPLWFYRDPSAPDLRISPEDLDLAAIRDARLLWLTVTGLSAEPSRAAHHGALRARNAGGITILDLDFRDAFWSSQTVAREEIARILGQVTVAVGNREECRVAVGEDDPEAAADALLDAGVEIAIVKQGPRGVLAKSRTETVQVASTTVEVVNGLGAGDGFGGSLCDGLLKGRSLRETIEYASVAGAIVASRLECSTAMPTIDEIEIVLGGGAPPPHTATGRLVTG